MNMLLWDNGAGFREHNAGSAGMNSRRRTGDRPRTLYRRVLLEVASNSRSPSREGRFDGRRSNTTRLDDGRSDANLREQPVRSTTHGTGD